MSSSYNISCSKHKLVVSIYSTTKTSLEMSTLAVWCRVVRSRDFSAPSCNCSAACLYGEIEHCAAEKNQAPSKHAEIPNLWYFSAYWTVT